MNIGEHRDLADALTHAVTERYAIHPERYAFALVYGVAFPSLYQEVRRKIHDYVIDRVSLIFDAEGDERGKQYGPFLIRLDHDNDASLIEVLASSCISDPCGMSFIFSRLSTLSLCEALRARLEVKCEDRTKWQLKFFDSRTLPVLSRTLFPEQFQRFFAIVCEWFYLDRDLALQVIAGSDELYDAYEAPLRLSEQQGGSFVDAAMPDAILHVIRTTDDDLTAAFAPKELYRIVSSAVANATAEERDSAPALADRARRALLDILLQQDKA